MQSLWDYALAVDYARVRQLHPGPAKSGEDLAPDALADLKV